MSVDISSGTIRVVSGNTTKFDAGRSTPHIISVLSGSVTMEAPTIYNVLASLGWGEGPVYLAYGDQWSAQRQAVYMPNPSNTVLFCYYRIDSCPGSAKYGQLNILSESSDWVGTNGGMLARVWTSSLSGRVRSEEPIDIWVGDSGLQGSQIVGSYVDATPIEGYPGYFYVRTQIDFKAAGIAQDEDVLGIFTESGTTSVNGSATSKSKPLSAAALTVSYKIHVGVY